MANLISRVITGFLLASVLGFAQQDVFPFSSSGSGSAAATTPAIRGTGLQSVSATTFTVSWPSGTAAGDLAIIFGGHGCGITTPTGWNQLSNTGQISNWSGFAASRVLNSTDITATSVSVTAGCAFDGTFGIVTFVGNHSIRASSFSFSNAASTTVTTNSDGSPITTDMVIYFGSERGAATDTVSLGTMKQQTNDTSAASGCIYAGSPASNGGVSPVFSYPSYSGGGAGYYQAVIAVY